MSHYLKSLKICPVSALIFMYGHVGLYSTPRLKSIMYNYRHVTLLHNPCTVTEKMKMSNKQWDIDANEPRTELNRFIYVIQKDFQGKQVFNLNRNWSRIS